ncbi:hypothetical protein PMAYCL1PPCAC_16601, partial [Pristionchus mayeri]
LSLRYLSRVPLSEVFDGLIWPRTAVTPGSVRALSSREFGEDDIVIASYPKSGTTWVSEILSAIVHGEDTDALSSIMLEIRAPWLELDRSILPAGHFLNCPSAKFSKTKNVWITHLPLRHLPASIKLLYMARNPKDQAVSYYHFHKMTRYLGQQNDLAWDDFFSLFCSGALCWGDWFDHVLAYWKFAQANPNAKFIFYEDLKKDLLKGVTELEKFIDTHLTLERRSWVVEHCSFEAMKDNTMANRSLLPNFDDKIGKFMRKGIVGDWKNCFTTTQSEAFDELYKKKFEGSGLHFTF